MISIDPDMNDLYAKHYRVIKADPPWDHRSNSAKKPGRNARRHYKTMSLDAIAQLPVKDLVMDQAILWLWITGPFLATGAHIPIMSAWGFKPSGMGFVWIKLNKNAKSEPRIFRVEDLFMGGGFTTRKNAEFCLIGKRGGSPRIDKSVHEVIISPRREHSRKPDESFERVERYCPGPRLEMFSRQPRAGWDTWGNEAEKFAPLTDLKESA